MIVLDAGNTRIKVGYYVADDLVSAFIPPEVQLFAPASQPLGVVRQVLKLGLPPQCWRIAATGCRFETQTFIQSVLEVRPDDTFKIITWRDIPLEHITQTPEIIGIDRLLGVYAASVIQPDMPLLVVDAGSAVTVDCVWGGTYHGGAILPGFRFLADVYPNISTRLPRIDTAFSTLPPYPCRNTEESIAAGIYWSIIGSVRQFVELSGIETVFLAGGDSPVLCQALKRYFSNEHLFLKPELVLCGICAVLGNNF